MKRKLLRAFLSASLLCLAFMASAQVSVTITGFSNCHCNGGSDGMATASASGGTAPYTYSWLPAPGSGQGTSSVSNLSPGVYTVTVHDFASNVGSQTVTITAPPALVLTPAVLGTTCGLSNGSATMNVTGGTAPYVYSWHPLACTTPTFASLSPGTYSCFVTDNNGCSAMNNATVINGAAAPTVTTNFSDVNCHGASTGNVSATVSGGTPPYAYTWSPGNYTGANYNNIAAGNYTVNVTDNAGCSGNYTVTVSEPSLALTATLTESDVHCNGGSDGSVTATASGGVAGYTYSWSPVGGFNSNVTNVAANTYTCTVTDMHGCTYTGTTIVNQPPVLTLTPSAVNATCGTNNGSATMTVAGGTAPYSYNWIPGPCSTATFSGLASGTYSCDVIDNNGCGANNQAIVNAISTPVLTMSEVDVACQGTSSGSASVTVTGGTAPFTYLWSPNGATTANNTNIPAGTYTVTVTDASGCTVGNVTSVSEPTSALTATLAKNDVHCNGGNTGVAYVTASGGTAGYTYLWSSGGTGTTEPGLTAGTYTCSVTDNNGCTYSGTIVVGEPAAIIVSTSGTPVSCNGGNDGSVTATSSGGSAPYLYSWDPGGIKSQTVTGLVAGLYTCTVTDNMECSATANYTITEPTALVLTPSSTPATCASSNGSVTMTVTGGTVPYTYSWFSGPATATFSGLAAGTYSCDVQDNNGCGANNSAVVTAISAPVLTLSQVNVPCNGTSTGSASVSVTGGVAPYTYSWSAGGSVTATDNNIPVGTYSVVVTDASGCIKSTVTTLTQPTALYSSFTKTDVICNGGSTGAATVGAAGGTPGYTYLWSPGGAVNTSLTNLSAGIYTCTVTDANGCTYVNTTTIAQPTAIVPASTSTNITCYGVCNGVINVSATGGTLPYAYAWSPGGQTSVTVAGQCPGTYTCSVTDANGCISTAPVLTLSQPAQLVNTVNLTNATCNGCDGAEASVITGGTAPYTYLWSPGGLTTATITALCPGTYSVTATDANGCTQVGGGNITQSISPQISGTVIAPVSGAINSGMAYLVQYDSVLKRQQIVDSVAISSGSYSFNNSGGLKYLVYALANHTTYPNVIKTYAGNADQWINATIINAPCASTQTANITMIELTPPTGSGSLSGHVQQAAGYSPRMMPGNPIVLAPGDPIPGLDVNLEQHPGGIIAQTSTDATSGYYHFGNVPPGTFEVFVDVPGLGMVSQYTRTVTSTEMFPNLDYKVDSIHIYKDSVLVTSAPVIKTPGNGLWIAPNPSRDLLNITYTQPEAGDVVFELYSVIGEKVTAFTKAGAVSGTFQFHASDYGIPQGVYTLRMTAGNSVLIRRVVFIR